jgi:hypothetical protein
VLGNQPKKQQQQKSIRSARQKKISADIKKRHKTSQIAQDVTNLG